MGRPVRFYTDEQVPHAVARGLRRKGVDVLTAVDAGLLGATDEVHLERARAELRVLVTQDRDFLTLHAASSDHAGIAFAPQGTTVGPMVRGLLLIFHVYEGEDMDGRLEYL